jgi:hypothetical protein
VLDFIISTGFCQFPLSCTGELDYDNANELVLEIDKDQLRLRTFKKDGNIDPRNSFTTGYSVTYPKIILDPSDNKKLSFVMNDGNTELSEQDLAYNRKLLVNCLDQQTRDIIVMTIRVFALKNSMKIDNAIENHLEDAVKHKTDLYLQLEDATRELYSVIEDNNNLKSTISDKTKRNKLTTSTMKDEIEGYKSVIAQKNQEIENLEKSKDKNNKIINDFEEYKLKYEQALAKEQDLIQEINSLKISLEKNNYAEKEVLKLKKELEFAHQDLEIINAKDKALAAKLKRQTEAIETLTSERNALK